MHVRKTKTSILVLYLDLLFCKQYRIAWIWHTKANKKRIDRLMKLDGKTLEERYDTSHVELMEFGDNNISKLDKLDEYIYKLNKKIKYASKH